MREKLYREQAAYLRERAKSAGGFREDFLKLAEMCESEAATLRARAPEPAGT